MVTGLGWTGGLLRWFGCGRFDCVLVVFLLALCFDLDCLWVALAFVCLACLFCSGVMMQIVVGGFWLG